MDALALETIREIHQTDWWYRARARFIITTLNRLRKGFGSEARDWDILDAGCGHGAFTSALSQYGKASGIDVEPEVVEFARRNHPECSFSVGSIPEDVPDETYDLVTLLDVLEHLDNRVEALQRIRTCLRPKGWLLVTVPACPSLWSRRDEVNHHRLRYRRRQLIHDLTAAQFKLKYLTYFNTLMFPPIWIAAQVERLLGIRPERIVQQRDSTEKDLFVAPGALNQILYRLFLTESLVAGRLALPIGVSLLAVAEQDLINETPTGEST